MIGLDSFLDKPGVLAAGQFSAEGEMVRGVGKLDKEQMEHVAEICKRAANTLGSLTGELETATGMPWNELSGWVLMGGNLALCVTSDAGVIVDSRRADFNQILVDLFGPPAGGVPVP